MNYLKTNCVNWLINSGDRMNQQQKEFLHKVEHAYGGKPVVICDETNNTAEDIENNVLNLTVFVPAPVQFIKIESVVPKVVLCYRCLSTYDIYSAPLTKTKRLRNFEPECPNCGCRVYFS